VIVEIAGLQFAIPAISAILAIFLLALTRKFTQDAPKN